MGCKLKRKIKSNTNLVRIQYKPGENVGRPGWEGNVCGITWGCTDAVLMHTSSFPASLCKEQITKVALKELFSLFLVPPFPPPSLVVFFSEMLCDRWMLSKPTATLPAHFPAQTSPATEPPPTFALVSPISAWTRNSSWRDFCITHLQTPHSHNPTERRGSNKKCPPVVLAPTIQPGENKCLSLMNSR